MAVGPLHALEHTRTFFFGDLIHLLKLRRHGLSVLRQQTVLIPAADGHKLGKQLRHRLFIELPVGHGAGSRQLLLLPLRVEHRLTGLYLELRHLAAEPHPLSKSLTISRSTTSSFSLIFQ